MNWKKENQTKRLVTLYFVIVANTQVCTKYSVSYIIKCTDPFSPVHVYQRIAFYISVFTKIWINIVTYKMNLPGIVVLLRLVEVSWFMILELSRTLTKKNIVPGNVTLEDLIPWLISWARTFAHQFAFSKTFFKCGIKDNFGIKNTRAKEVIFVFSV